MKVYLVGGAVRDKLLNLPSHDRDWVVVGSSPEDMLAQGFQRVGREFPVFLHPKTHEEYALARTERKAGRGYKGFICDSSSEVTIEEDLQRRDLTINAIAEDQQGNIIDPYGGRHDIEQRQLRHVSAAFVEDPLRVLRVARFAARFHHLDFSVAAPTLQLMTTMVRDGEVHHLIAERVWQEIARALTEPNPVIFFQVLRQCGALAVVLPELDALFGIPQPEQYHPEIDCGEHALLSLQQATALSNSTQVRFASLLHDIGKAQTPGEFWPHHHGHEKLGKALLIKLSQRLKVPNEYRDLALLVCEYHTHCHRAKSLKASTLLKTLESLDAFRRPERFMHFLLCCEADAKGRTGLEDRKYEQKELFHRAYTACAAIDANQLLQSGLQGKALGDELRQQRIRVIKTIINTHE